MVFDEMKFDMLDGVKIRPGFSTKVGAAFEFGKASGDQLIRGLI